MYKNHITLLLLVSFVYTSAFLVPNQTLKGLLNRRVNLPHIEQSATRLSSLLSSSIGGGILSGGLHAITGPDHLAAVLPPSVGQPALVSMRTGAVWGLGHGISAVCLGIAAIILKDQMSSRFRFLERLSVFAESAVGFSLLFIGGLGIKEVRAMDSDSDDKNGGKPVSGLVTNQAIFSNGLLHGLSLDGAPSIAPALAMKNWRAALWFLASYCLGTMVTMSVTAGIIGESSSRLVEKSNDPKLMKRLCYTSSLLAIIAGIFWIAKTIF